MTTSKLSCSNPLTAVSLCVITDFGKSAPPRILKISGLKNMSVKLVDVINTSINYKERALYDKIRSRKASLVVLSFFDNAEVAWQQDL